MRWLVGAIAALTMGLAAAPVAGADPLDSNDRAFIAATDQVIMGSSGNDPEWRWWGYSDVPAQTRIDVAKEMCAGIDADPDVVVADSLVAALGPRKHAGYFAAWFEQIAITHYCPQHSDRIGII